MEREREENLSFELGGGCMFERVNDAGSACTCTRVYMCVCASVWVYGCVPRNYIRLAFQCNHTH